MDLFFHVKCKFFDIVNIIEHLYLEDFPRILVLSGLLNKASFKKWECFEHVSEAVFVDPADHALVLALYRTSTLRSMQQRYLSKDRALIEPFYEGFFPELISYIDLTLSMGQYEHVSCLLTLPYDIIILHELVCFNVLQNVIYDILLGLEVTDCFDGI